MKLLSGEQEDMETSAVMVEMEGSSLVLLEVVLLTLSLLRRAY